MKIEIVFGGGRNQGKTDMLPEQERERLRDIVTVKGLKPAQKLYAEEGKAILDDLDEALAKNAALLKAEGELSMAYVRLRILIPGALDTPPAPTPAQIWEITEAALKRLLALMDDKQAQIEEQAKRIRELSAQVEELNKGESREWVKGDTLDRLQAKIEEQAERINDLEQSHR